MAELKLGPVDELPQLRTNTTLLLGFALPDSVDRAEVMKCLQSATNTLVDTFPFLAGQITVSGASEDKLDANKHVPGHLVAVVLNDLSELSPNYQEIIKAKAPASMLDGGRVGQGDGFPDHSTGHTLDPCFGMRANFVKGGLLLTFALSHSIGDGTSLGQVIKMFATACRGDAISKVDVEAGNMNRPLSLPSLRSGENQLDHSDMTAQAVADHTTHNGKDEQTAAPSKRWAYFRIPYEKLVQLKAEVLASLSVDDKHILISSNDGFSALIWRAITLAKLPHLDSSAATTMMRAVNCRRKLDPPLPESTLQNVIEATYTTCSLQDFSKIPLGSLASKLRKDLLNIDSHHIRSMATHIRSTRDKNLLQFGARLSSNDMVITSFAHMPICTTDFGPLLGEPDFVRRPTLTAVDGLVYLMPKNADGSIDAGISMMDDDLERMHLDEKWAYYTEYIG
ncbi:MAG: hypothetical protein Q9195_008997 [Heterodermia aff. obscurata]